MVEKSVDEGVPRRDPTRSIRAGLFVADEVAAYFMMERDVARQMLMDEPIERVVGVIEWLQKHEEDEDFDPEVMLVRWARKRGAGPFRKKCEGCSGRHTLKDLVEVDEENQDGMHPAGTLLCASCADMMGVER
jgi:hypothetical protein